MTGTLHLLHNAIEKYRVLYRIAFPYPKWSGIQVAAFHALIVKRYS